MSISDLDKLLELLRSAASVPVLAQTSQPIDGIPLIWEQSQPYRLPPQDYGVGQPRRRS